MGSKDKKKNRNNPSAEKKDAKVSDGGGEGSKLVTDERFSRVHWDPRFRPLPKHKNKVELDPRFKSMFSDKRFSSSEAPLDKRGRPKKQNKQNPLHRYYRIEENKDKEEETDEEVEEKEKEVEEENAGSEEELEGHAAALKTGQLSDESEESEPASSSEAETVDTESTIDTDEDDEDHVYEEEEEVQEQEENIPNIDKETHRLAVVNMDWRHVKAVDLFVVLSSFLPNNGRILSVSVYPSEFGLQRMKEEEVHGPVGLFDGDNDEEENTHEENDEVELDKEKLRAYEKSRLRYFYAVVECDSVSTADYLYTACDGAEFERSSNVFDLRFIPDSMEFKHPPRDVATEAPTNYDGLDFQTRCLQQSNIELTWDEDEPERVKTFKQKFNAEQLADMELRDYLASDESDSDDEEENKDANNGEDKDKKRNKYLSLLGDDSENGSGDDEDEKQDMEVTFNPGLEDLGKRILEKKAAQSETVFESFLRKRKEKKMMRKNKSKSAQLSDDNSSDASEGDDFFVDEAPVKKGSKKDRHGKDKTENENKESAVEEKEATAAELELLFADDTGGAGNTGPKGFNLKRKNAKGKKKKNGKENPDEDNVDQLAKLPTLDDIDSRFSDIFTSEFALDPTDPNYIRSATYLRQAATKKHKKKGDDSNEAPPEKNHPVINKVESSTPNSGSEKHELSSLVKSLKMKSKQVVPLTNKEEDRWTTRRDNKRNREEEKKAGDKKNKGKKKKVKG